MTHQNPNDLNGLLAAARAVFYHGTAGNVSPEVQPPPFVTISRQAGAGGRTLARTLVERLNEVDPGDRPWTCWDHELLEQVAAEHHIGMRALEAYEEEKVSLIQDFLKELFAPEDATDPPEFKVHRRVASTMRALARAGRCVLVGRAGAFTTAGIPGGVHVRLVAPVEFRVKATARQRGIGVETAADWVRKTDESRAAFYRRHWPNKPVIPEMFAVTINVAAVTVERAAEAVLQLVPRAERHGPSCRRCQDPRKGQVASVAAASAREKSGPLHAGAITS